MYRWVKEVRLPELEFARVLPLPILFSAAATMFPAELSEARIAWSMSSVLTTIVDDLFDTGESMEELENLVTLFDLYACSRRVTHNSRNRTLTRLTT
jgi:hypothetical protein